MSKTARTALALEEALEIVEDAHAVSHGGVEELLNNVYVYLDNQLRALINDTANA